MKSKLRPGLIAFWTTTGLFCIGVGLSGVSHFMHEESMVEAMTGLGYPLFFMTIIGLAKMAGVVTVLAPGFSARAFSTEFRWRPERGKRRFGITSGGQPMSGLRRIALNTVLFLFVLGCGGPMLVFPGGALSGEVVTEAVEDWSFVTASYVDVEFRPDDPYSVQLNYVVKDGMLYIDPKEGRRWFDYLRADSRVRARFDGKVYALTAVLVGGPGELEGFDEDRFIYRLDARP